MTYNLTISDKINYEGRMQQLQNENESTEEFDDYHKLEMSQVFERFNAIEDKRIQLGIFFGTANLTIIGIALSVQKVGILLIGVSILIIFMLMDMRVRENIAINYYRGLQLQKKYAPKDSETFWKIFQGRLFSKIREISEKEDLQSRLEALNRINWSTPSFIGFWMILIVIILEIIVSYLLLCEFGWLLF